MKKFLAILLSLCIALGMTVLAPVTAAAQTVSTDQISSESAATPDEAVARIQDEPQEMGKETALSPCGAIPASADSFYGRIRVSSNMGLYVTANEYGNVVLSKDGSSSASSWLFQKQDDGYYKILNRKHNKYLDVCGGGNANGTNVQIWDSNDTNTQRWWLYKAQDCFLLRPKCATDCTLDVYSGNLESGANLQIFQINYSAAQLFSIAGFSVNAPTLTKLINSNGSQKLSWAEGTVKPAKYRVYIKSDGKWKKLADTASTTYANKNVKSGSNYAYTVAGLDKNGRVITEKDTDGLALKYIATPQFSLKNVNGGVRISWSAVKGAVNYRVMCISSNGDIEIIGTTTNLSWTNKSVKSGTKYTYAVRCISKDGTINTSAYVKKSITYIAQPKISKISYSADGHVIKWGKIKGAAKYRVFVKSGSKWKKLGETTKNSYTYKKAKIGTKYTYTVCCISKNGKKVTSAYDTKGTSFRSLKAPKIKKLIRSYYSIGIWWKQVGGAKSYRIYYRTKSPTGNSSWSSWYELATVQKNVYGTDNYYYHRAYGGYKYQYRVRCITPDGCAQSAYSKNSEGIRFCKAPDLYQGGVCSDKLRIYWYSSPGAYQYRVYLWDESKSKWKTLGTTWNLYYYYYTNDIYGKHRFGVRAIDSEGHNMSEIDTMTIEYSRYNGLHVYSY